MRSISRKNRHASRTANGAGALFVAAFLVMASGCDTAPDSDPAIRNGQSDATPVVVVHADGPAVSDLGEAAHRAGTVATGRFTATSAPVDIGALFPAEPAESAPITYVVAKFQIEETVLGSLSAGDTIAVLIPTWELDVPGARNDPAQFGDERIVLLLEGKPVDTSQGKAYFLAANQQLGASIAEVSDTGVVKPVPQSRIGLPPSSDSLKRALSLKSTRSSEAIADLVAQQLGLDAGE